MNQAYLRSLRPSSQPPAEANPPTNPSTTSTEDNSPANPSATSTEDNSPANPSRTSTEGSPPTDPSRTSADITEPAQANFTKVRAEAPRNVHFLDARNKEVAGFWQNGSVVWEEVQEWMHIIIKNAQSSYTPFQYQETGYLEDPAGQHGLPIHMANNRSTVDAGYYVLLAYNGECESSNHYIHLIDTLISSHRFQRRDQRHS
jgi:hypothetical protein